MISCDKNFATTDRNTTIFVGNPTIFVELSTKFKENCSIPEEKFIKIFKDGKWQYCNKEEILDDLIQTNYCRLDGFYEDSFCLQ